MRMGNWEGLAPVTAGIALLVLVFLPQKQMTINLESPAVHDAGQIALEMQESGSQVSWDDSNSGLSGVIMPLRVFRDERGHWCRHYILTVDGGDRPESISRTACRHADGQWRNITGTTSQVADSGG